MYYNTAHIYDVLEILDMKAELMDIEKIEFEEEKARKDQQANAGKR